MADSQIWLVRHGATAWSRERRHTGRTDVPLEPEGEAAARALAGRLAEVRFDLALASPLQRAWRTAELAGLTPEPAPLAVEWDYGEYEGLTTTQVRERVPDWSIWTGGVPGGETLEQVAARADAVIAQLRRRAPARAVLVSHAHFLRVMASRWSEQPPTLAAHLLLEPTGLSVLSQDRGIPVIQCWNT